VTPTSSATSEQTPVVSIPIILGVTTCPECGTPFTPKNERQRFCKGSCRQKAYRRSPAHRAVLDGLTNQRTNRRVDHFHRKNAFKSIGLDVHSGPDAVGVPRVGMLDLKQFPKTPNPFVPFTRKEWKQKQRSVSL